MSLVQLFNNHILEFIDDICNIIENNSDLLQIKLKFKKLIFINSTKPIKLWKEFCLKYDDEIEKKNYQFFFNICYDNDNVISNEIEKYKLLFMNETNENKKKFMMYIYNLNKITKLYYMSKTN